MPTNPLITALPPMPVRGDSPEDFTAKANAALGALAQLQSELNILSDWTNTTSDAINLAKANAESARDTAITVKNTAVSAKDTAVIAKNNAESARDAAIIEKNATVAAKNEAVTAKNTAVAIAQGGNVLATDALRAAGDSIILAKGDGTTESVPFVATNSARALHADALRISGSNIQLVKANGASETISVGTLYKNVAVGGVGSTVFARGDNFLDINFGTVVAGSLLRVSSSSDNLGVSLSGSWISCGQNEGNAKVATVWKRIA